MKRALIFRLVSLLTCGLLRMAADALETEQQLLDIAPFALPGTPANEVRFTHTIKDNTPERYRTALQTAKRRLLAQKDGPCILNINCWNEWTEGSYLEPDTVNGMKYLEAVRDVFGTRRGTVRYSKN